VVLDWGELLTITLGAGVAGYYLHAGLTRRVISDERELQSAVRKVEQSLPEISRHEIQREIERLETRLTELKARQKESAEKQ
jgi:hypothetical protein